MELLERESALAELDRAVESAVDNEGRMVIVEGPAGIGKSALVAAFLESYDGLAVTGVCDDLSIPAVLGGFEDVVRGDPSLEEAFEAGTSALRSALQQVFDEGSTVIAIEDIHWADEATIDLLSSLARRLVRLPVVIIVTVRTELPTGHPVLRLLGSIPPGLGKRITLSELTPEAVARMVEGNPRMSAADVYYLTGGNPFLVTELLTWGEPVPATVADSVSARIAALPAPAGEVASLLAVIPGQASWELTDHMLPDGAEPLADLELAGVIASSPDGVAYRHELLRRAVAERLSPPVNRDLNRVVLRSLLALGRSSSRIAHHAAAAGEIDVLLHHGRGAIDEAVRAGAHTQALAHVLNVLPYVQRLPLADQANLWRVAALEYRANNDLESSASAIENAIGLRKQLDDLNELAADIGYAATIAWERSRSDEGRRLRQQAISILESLGPSKELAFAYVTYGQDLSLASQLPEALVWIDKAIDVAVDEDVRAMAYSARSAVRLMLGEGEDARSDGDIALEIFVRRHDHDRLALTHINRIAAQVNALHLNHVESDLSAAVELSSDLDLARFATSLAMQAGRLHLLRGRWNVAREAAERALQRIPSGIGRATGLVVEALVAGRRGEPSAVEVLEEAVGLVANTEDIQRIRGVCSAVAEFTWLGLMDEIDLIRAGYELAAGSGFQRGHAELALWLRRLGQDAIREGPSSLPFAHELAGDHSSAAAAWREMGVPYQQALTMAFSGDQALMRASLEILDHLEAGPVRDRVRQMMRDLGFTVGRRKSATTRANPRGLTNRQIEVLELLKEDLTDREIAERLFISPKTVGHHVSAILAKLGVSSRRQAAHRPPDK